MARPAGANAERTRARVRREAARLFASQGVGGTSMREIARASGVTSATVHHYFGSKEGLREAVVAAMDAELGELRGVLEEAVGEAAGPGLCEVVELIVRRMFRFARAHDATVRLLLREAVDAGELDPERRGAMHLPFLATAADALGRLTGRPPQQTRLAAQSVQHLVVRFALTGPGELALVAGLPHDTDEATTLAAVEDHLVDAAFRLLQADRPAP